MAVPSMAPPTPTPPPPSDLAPPPSPSPSRAKKAAGKTAPPPVPLTIPPPIPTRDLDADARVIYDHVAPAGSRRPSKTAPHPLLAEPSHGVPLLLREGTVFFASSRMAFAQADTSQPSFDAGAPPLSAGLTTAEVDDVDLDGPRPWHHVWRRQWRSWRRRAVFHAAVTARTWRAMLLHRDVMKATIAWMIASGVAFLPVSRDTFRNSSYFIGFALLFFHPGRSMGAMVECVLACGMGLLVGYLTSIASLAMVEHYTKETSRDIFEAHVGGMLILSLSTFCLGYVRARYGYARLAIGSGCSVAHLLTFLTITQMANEDALQYIRPKIIHNVGALATGTAISALVNVLLWPSPASRQLHINIGRSLDSFCRFFDAVSDTIVAVEGDMHRRRRHFDHLRGPATASSAPTPGAAGDDAIAAASAGLASGGSGGPGSGGGDGDAQPSGIAHLPLVSHAQAITHAGPWTSMLRKHASMESLDPDGDRPIAPAPRLPVASVAAVVALGPAAAASAARAHGPTTPGGGPAARPSLEDLVIGNHKLVLGFEKTLYEHRLEWLSETFRHRTHYEAVVAAMQRLSLQLNGLKSSMHLLGEEYERLAAEAEREGPTRDPLSPTSVGLRIIAHVYKNLKGVVQSSRRVFLVLAYVLSRYDNSLSLSEEFVTLGEADLASQLTMVRGYVHREFTQFADRERRYIALAMHLVRGGRDAALIASQMNPARVLVPPRFPMAGPSADVPPRSAATSIAAASPFFGYVPPQPGLHAAAAVAAGADGADDTTPTGTPAPFIASAFILATRQTWAELDILLDTVANLHASRSRAAGAADAGAGADADAARRSPCRRRGLLGWLASTWIGRSLRQRRGRRAAYDPEAADGADDETAPLLGRHAVSGPASAHVLGSAVPPRSAPPRSAPLRPGASSVHGTPTASETLYALGSGLSPPEPKPSGIFDSPVPPSRWQTSTHTPGLHDPPLGRVRRVLVRLARTIRSHELRYAAKCAVIIAIMALPAFMDETKDAYYRWRLNWALTSAVVVLTPTAGASNQAGFYRLAGTLGGALASVAYWHLFHDNYPLMWAMGLLLAWPAYAIFLRGAYPKIGQIFLLTYSVCLLSRSAGLPDAVTGEVWTIEEIALQRAVAVSTGIVAGMLTLNYIWPFKAREALRLTLSSAFFQMGVLYQQLVYSITSQASGATHIVVRVPGSALSGPPSAVSLAVPHVTWTVDGAGAQGGAQGGAHDDDDTQRPPQAARARRSSILRHASAPTHPMAAAFSAHDLGVRRLLVRATTFLSGAAHEPRIRGAFPAHLYREVLQAAERLLSHFVALHAVVSSADIRAMAGTPAVATLVAAPVPSGLSDAPLAAELEACRRAMVGEVLLTFYVFASALQMKAPMPPTLPQPERARQRLLAVMQHAGLLQHARANVHGSHAPLANGLPSSTLPADLATIHVPNSGIGSAGSGRSNYLVPAALRTPASPLPPRTLDPTSPRAPSALATLALGRSPSTSGSKSPPVASWLDRVTQPIKGRRSGRRGASPGVVSTSHADAADPTAVPFLGSPRGLPAPRSPSFPSPALLSPFTASPPSLPPSASAGGAVAGMTPARKTRAPLRARRGFDDLALKTRALMDPFAPPGIVSAGPRGHGRLDPPAGARPPSAGPALAAPAAPTTAGTGPVSATTSDAMATLRARTRLRTRASVSGSVASPAGPGAAAAPGGRGRPLGSLPFLDRPSSSDDDDDNDDNDDDDDASSSDGDAVTDLTLAEEQAITYAMLYYAYVLGMGDVVSELDRIAQLLERLFGRILF